MTAVVVNPGVLRFNACPKCGGALASDWHLTNEPAHLTCVNCGKEVKA